MQIFVQTFFGKTLILNIDEGVTALDLKQNLFDQLSIPIKEQRLMFGGKQLEDKKSLSDYKILPESECNLVLNLKGGNTESKISGNELQFRNITTNSYDLAVTTFHLSCSSSRPSTWESGEVTGMVIFSNWDQSSPKYVKARPGYVFLWDSKGHSGVFYQLFGEYYEPNGKHKDMLVEGFAYHEQKWKYNSSTFNQGQNKKYQNEIREMHPNTSTLLKKCIVKWQAGAGQNIPISDIK